MHNPPSDQRVIRVFVSSTFRDMQAERDELVLKIFPQLRRLCEERGVTWGEIDLRWGITEEQSQRGEVLPICLAEIRRCRPYFIGLLGQRYGWIPDAVPAHLQVANGLNNLAHLFQASNRLAKAEPLMRRALAIREQGCGPNHPTVAQSLNNLAVLLQVTNRLAEAEALIRRALAIWEQSLGKDHHQVAAGLTILAQLLEATNRLAEAEPLLRRALAIDERFYGANHPSVADALNNLALLLHDTNRFAETEPLVRRMVVICLKSSQDTQHEHPHLQAVIENYAGILQAMGLSEAEVRRRLNELLADYGLSLE